MSIPPASPAQDADLVRRVRDRLGGQGWRLTRARRLVVEMLARSSGPLAVAGLDRALGGTVPLSSLYRTLVVLEQAGIVARYVDPTGIARFELAEWLAGHHHHLTCVECGMTRDLEPGDEAEAMVGSLVERVASTAGFEVRSHRLDMEGVCASCLTR